MKRKAYIAVRLAVCLNAASPLILIQTAIASYHIIMCISWCAVVKYFKFWLRFPWKFFFEQKEESWTVSNPTETDIQNTASEVFLLVCSLTMLRLTVFYYIQSKAFLLQYDHYLIERFWFVLVLSQRLWLSCTLTCVLHLVWNNLILLDDYRYSMYDTL